MIGFGPWRKAKAKSGSAAMTVAVGVVNSSSETVVRGNTDLSAGNDIKITATKSKIVRL